MMKHGDALLTGSEFSQSLNFSSAVAESRAAEVHGKNERDSCILASRHRVLGSCMMQEPNMEKRAFANKH